MRSISISVGGRAPVGHFYAGPPMSANLLSDDQLRWLAITPKLTASISFVSTAFIIWDVLRSKTKRGHTYHQFIVALSVCDLIIAVGTFLSTWPIPAPEQESAWRASGTRQTCTAQGFFLQFTITAPLYNGSLSLYYLLMITFNWGERRLKRMRLWGPCVNSYLWPWDVGRWSVPDAVQFGQSVVLDRIGTVGMRRDRCESYGAGHHVRERG